MRKFLAMLILTVTLAVQSGCIVPIWHADPAERVRQMIFASESMRHIPEIWDRIWGLDMPDLATPYRTHGGVI